MERTYQHIQLTIRDHTARVALNRPPVNALNREMIEELSDAAKRISADDAIWLVVVSSTQKVFCAGADLKERAGVPDTDVMTFVRRIQDLTRVWGEIPQPVVMGVRGTALGGGLEFALAGDLIAVSDTTVLGFPEVSLGIIPAAGGTQRMALRSSLGVARKWVLTAEKFSAAEALADGVVDFVFHTPDFDAKLEWLTGNLLANAPRSLRQAKQALNHFSRTTLSAGLDAELAAYEPLVPTEDRREALRAFAENRKPKWEGK